MKDIKAYEKVFTNERRSKDLVFYGEGWENFDKYEFAFFFFFFFLGVIRNVSPFVAQNI